MEQKQPAVPVPAEEGAPNRKHEFVPKLTKVCRCPLCNLALTLLRAANATAERGVWFMDGPLWREAKPAFRAYDELLKARRRAHRTESDPTGAAYCRKVLVKPLVDRLARGPPKNVIPLIGNGTEAERTADVEFLNAYCAVCGLCSALRAKAVIAQPRRRTNHSG